MSQPTNANDLSMDNVFDGSPWVTRIPGAPYNLLSMDVVFDGSPFVAWNPDAATTKKQKSQVLYYMWGN